MARASSGIGAAGVGHGPTGPGFGVDPGKGNSKGKSGKGTKKKRSSIPRWARVCTVLGALLMVVSGGLLVTSEALLARYEGAVETKDLFGDGVVPEKKSDIKGPLNVLLVGIDPRNDTTPPLADSIMIMHIPDGLDRGYLFSLPRDLYVDIPPFPKANFRGGKAKLNAAMSEGSIKPGGGKPDRVQGFELLSKTVSAYTGIERFDAGAIVNFQGFKRIVDAMGGVTMTVDEDEVLSEHLKPNGEPRPRDKNCGCEHPYYGPQAKYVRGTHKLKGWQALDYVRQRYTVEGGDYGRQRHQQQFIRAMAKQALSGDVLSNPLTLDKVLKAAGSAVEWNGRGYSVAEFGFALRDIRESSIHMIKLQGGGLESSGGKYLGEKLNPDSAQFFAAVRNGTVDTYVATNPKLLNKTK